MLFVAIGIALVLVGVAGLYAGHGRESFWRDGFFAVGLGALVIGALMLFLVLLAITDDDFGR